MSHNHPSLYKRPTAGADFSGSIFARKDTIRTFFVAKNVLKKKATYTTNIAGIPEMKVLLKEAFCGVFKTNVTRYMVQLIKKNSYEKLLESLPLL